MPESGKVLERGAPASGPVLAVLLLLPIVLFYGLTAWLNTGLPTEDDFHGLFGFALRWHGLQDWVHRLFLIVTFQHNEYKMPLPYSLLGLELTLTHTISIPLWIWVGNLLALTMLVPLWLTCAEDAPLRERLLMFVPVVWIVMSLGYAETVDFALSGLQVILVVSLSMAAIFCITRASAGYAYLGCLFALLACATYANAFLLAPIGLQMWRKGRKLAFAIWVTAFALPLAAFLYRYHFLPHMRPQLSEGVLFFLTVTGGSFGFHRIVAGALFCGAMLLALFVYMVKSRADRVQPFAFSVAVWLLLGFALTTYGRGWVGVSAALASRYKIYGDLLLAVLYLQVVALSLAGRLPRLRLQARLSAVIAAAVVFGLYSDALGWYRLNARRIDVIYGTHQYVATHGAASPMVYPVTSPDYQRRPEIEQEARRILTEVLQKGLYNLPKGYQ